MSDEVKKISDSIDQVRISNEDRNATSQQPSDFHRQILDTRAILRRRHEAQIAEEKRIRDAEREEEEARKKATKAQIINRLKRETEQSLPAQNRRTPTSEEIALQKRQLQEAIASRARQWRATRSKELYEHSEVVNAEVRRTFEHLAKIEDEEFKEKVLEEKEEAERKAFDERVKKMLDDSRAARKAAVLAEIEKEENKKAALMMDHFKHQEALEQDRAKLLREKTNRLRSGASAPTPLHHPEPSAPPKPIAQKTQEKSEEKIKSKDIDWQDIIQSSLSVNDKKIIAGEMIASNLGEYAMWKRHTDGRRWHSLTAPQQYDDFKEFMFLTNQWEPTSAQKKWLEERKKKREEPTPYNKK